MQTTPPNKSLLDKLQKIAGLADGERALGNEAAADAFMEKLTQLLVQHKLELSDVLNHELQGDQTIDASWVDWSAGGFKPYVTSQLWMQILVHRVAVAYGCNTIRNTQDNGTRIIGTSSNRAIAEYLAVTLIATALRQVKRETAEFSTESRNQGRKADTRSFRQAWLHGFTSRIGERMREEVNRPVETADGTTTALVVMQGDKDRAVAFTRANFQTRRGRGYQVNRGFGYDQGRDAANRANIHGTGIGGGRPTRSLN